MKNLKFVRLLPLILGIVLITIITSSCEEDKEIIPEYMGKWMTLKPVSGTSGFVSVQYSLELAGNTFIETFLTGVGQYPREAKFVTMEGSISISGKIIKLIVHQVSYSNYNTTTATASEPYETHEFEFEDFGFEFEGTGMSTSNHYVEYEIVDNQLILKVDYNRDSIYSENEKSAYTKQ